MKVARGWQRVPKHSSKAEDLRGIVATTISVSLREQFSHLQTGTEKLTEKKKNNKIGTVVAKVK